MNSQFLGALFFVGLVFTLIYVDLNSKIDVTICENNNLTTYVNRKKPGAKIKAGECRSEIMFKSEYYDLKQTFSNIH